MADAITDAAIAALWPQQWARANAAPRGASKKRQQLRRAYRVHLETARLRSEGASCGNCKHIRGGRKLPVGMSGGKWCELHSDFHGYQMVDEDEICTSWGRKA